MHTLTLDSVNKSFGQVQVLDQVSLEMESGGIMALTGASGSGKTTLLRLIAGLEKLSAGDIYMDGQPVRYLPPEKRNIGFVFQDLALFPHFTVLGNIGFALHKLSRKRREQRVQELMDITGITGLGSRYPHQLSGGQQQRVALARALATDPAILLMDEPFSSLDEQLRARVRTQVYNIIKDIGITTIMVTHQAVDAFMMADQVVILKDGRVLQSGTPTDLYHHPRSEYVSDFFGASIWMEGKGNGKGIETPFGCIPYQKELPEAAFQVFVRPENVKIAAAHTGDLHGKIKHKLFKGPHEVLIIANEVDSHIIHFETEHTSYNPGDRIHLKVEPRHIHVFGAE